MISPEIRAQIRRYFYAEHWKVGTIATELGVHLDAVRHAIETERFHSSKPLGASVVDPYIEFIRHTLDQHPRLRATRLYQMIRDRGYGGKRSCGCRWRHCWTVLLAPAAAAKPSCNSKHLPASKCKSTGLTFGRCDR